MQEIRPQPGFQESFLSSSADIVIGGSGAGVGKTFALLLEGLRNVNNKGFNFVFFRRTIPEIRNAGGMRDESMSLYNIVGATPKESTLVRNFPSGATGKFAGIEYEKDVYNRQGSQICLIGFDELCHFSKTQFFYMLSRNRSSCGVRPYVRATCNPDPYSWVAEFIKWWIDPETGFPIPERAGKIRYFLQDNDNYLRGDSVEGLLNEYPYLLEREDFKVNKASDLIKSVAFIPGSIYDNKKLLSKDPGYLGNLLSQSEYEKKKLLGGCWKPYENTDTLINYKSIKDSFSIQLTNKGKKYISCDVAGFGSDLAIIGIWEGLQLKRCYIYTKSTGDDLKKCIEENRIKEGIPKSDVIIDTDGIGGGVADKDYTWFHNDGKALNGDNYKNIKTQCAYKLGEMMNTNKISICDTERYVDGNRSNLIKKSNVEMTIEEIIVKELSSIRRSNIDKEGKLQINNKSEQKGIVGWSPDFADMILMRMYFELNGGNVLFIG